MLKCLLNGHVIETIFMDHPLGFLDPQFPNHVSMLQKALYGLKQAPRAWFQWLSTFLVTIGFICSRDDIYFFIKWDYPFSACLFMLMTSSWNQPTLIRSCITRLHRECSIKDLGPLSYFWSLEVTYNSDSLFLNQAKYAHDVLTRVDLLNTKPVATPLSTSDYSTSSDAPFNDPTTYCSLVGAL